MTRAHPESIRASAIDPMFRRVKTAATREQLKARIVAVRQLNSEHP